MAPRLTANLVVSTDALRRGSARAAVAG